MKKPPLIILTGPTAVGKTALSLALARAVGGEIISADSMQVYRQMDIGTAKLPMSGREGVPHHLIDVLEPTEAFHIQRFQQLAKQCIAEILERGHIPILVGGTGFYIQAVLYDVAFTEQETDEAYRAELLAFADEQGAEALHERLRAVDAAAAAEIHPNNVKRCIRALEFYHTTGEKISAHNQEQRARDAAYRFAYFVLNRERETLYRAIDARVEEMLAAGLLDEVKRLRAQGLHKGLVSMQGIGYRQLLGYLDGEYPYEEAVRILKRDTRHYAKRQLTWFGGTREVTWLNREDFADNQTAILTEMLRILQERAVIA